MLAGAILCTLGTLAAPGGRFAGQEPWVSRAHPSDVPRRHTEEITQGTHRYTVVQGGTMDGRNCRTPLGCGMSREGACEQVWESNRSVRMENIGDTDVIDPWLSNGRNDFRTLDEIVSAAVAPGMSEREKAFALWWQETRHRYHFGGDNNELGDPVKVFNVYGYNTCGNDSICLAGLWRRAGLRAAPARAVGHCISQVFYEGAWHLYDGDTHAVYLMRDNQTVAGEQDIVHDHDLVKRTHNQGLLFPDTRAADEQAASLYVFEGPVGGERNCRGDTTMGMTLRPGEALVWRWGHLNPVKYHGHQRPLYPDTICNGLWEYRPDFSKETWRRGASLVENVSSSPEGLAAEEGKTGLIIWTMRSPYVFVGGRLEVEGGGVEFSISADGKAWEEVKDGVLDRFFAPAGPARYEYRIRCRLTGAARLRRLAVVNDLQMAFLALPEMGVGKNSFLYTDRCPGGRKVRITHEWVERSLSRPPEPPPSAIFPPDGGEAEGTAIAFRWTAPADPDGDRIADYHFELSDRPDLRWPLSMDFYKLISRTADRGRAQYTLRQPGLLTPDRKYYWRVRAKDEKGVWGPWSRVWSFIPRGPAHPLEVALDYDPARGLGTLRWKPNPTGRKPAKYRIYGSDEKGFSVSDEPYPVRIGLCKELPATFPANFITETAATELAVLGPDVELPGAQKTYYRVVAVDERGNRSGPSDYAAAPRPVFTRRPEPVAKVGVEYRSQVAANRSLGDLRTRQIQGGEAASFWDIEKPVFALARGPAWLRIDPATGLLSGTPDAPGKIEAVVTVVIDREVRQLDESALKWGNEKVIATGTERVGAAELRFTIDVRE